MKRTFTVSVKTENVNISIKGTINSNRYSLMRHEVDQIARGLASEIMRDLTGTMYVNATLADVKVKV